MSGQIRDSGIYQVWDGDEIIAVIAWGPRGYQKVCDTASEALGFIAGEFRALGLISISLETLAAIKVALTAGYRPIEAADLRGDLIAIEHNPVEYYGFDEARLLVVRSTKLDEALGVLVKEPKDILPDPRSP